MERSRPKIAAGPTDAFHFDGIENLWSIVPSAQDSKAVTQKKNLEIPLHGVGSFRVMTFEKKKNNKNEIITFLKHAPSPFSLRK